MVGEADPYSVLGVARDASDAEIHRAYRVAVRRTHPDAGGSSAAFEAVQKAYETLRDPGRRRAWDAAHAPRRPGPTARPQARPAPGDRERAGRSMEELLAESRRLEAEARRLEAQARRMAGLDAREGPGGAPAEEAGDSFGAIARDAGKQLREAADRGAEELRRLARRWL